MGKDKGYSLCEVKTVNSRRSLQLSPDVIALLSTHREKQLEQREFMGTDWQDSGLVFTTTLGTPHDPHNIRRSFTRITKPLIEAGTVRPIRIHDLRHTYASLALRRGIPVEVVSQRLGHAQVSITLDTYRHLYQAEKQAAALNLTDLLNEVPRVVN